MVLMFYRLKGKLEIIKIDMAKIINKAKIIPSDNFSFLGSSFVL
jgi:hypothetical protein